MHRNLRTFVAFAGGGGSSHGIKLALGRDPDAACNHATERELIRRSWRGREDEANAARDNPVPLRNPHVEAPDYIDDVIAAGEDPSRHVWHELDGRGMRDEDYEAWHLGAEILRPMRTPAILFTPNPYAPGTTTPGGWGGSITWHRKMTVMRALAAYPEDLRAA
jgi:hypothetical protein